MASSSQLGSQVADPEKPKKKKKRDQPQPDPNDAVSPVADPEKLKKKKKRDQPQSEPNDAVSPVADPEKPKKKKKKRDRSQPEPQDTAFPAAPRPKTPETIRVKVEVVYDRPDRSLPIVGYFPSGYDPTRAEPEIEFYRKVEERRKGSERMELVVRPSGESNVEFVGTTYRGEAASGQLCTYALGVLNKENGTLKIVPVSGNKIFRLDPKVHRTDVVEPSDAVNGDISKEDKLKKLTETFGTKQSKIKARKMAAMNMGTNPEALDDLSKMIEDASVNKGALGDTSAHVAQNIPPHNISATTPQEAYPLDKIIFTGEWDFLDDVYQKLQADEEMEENAYPSFVRNRMRKLKSIQDETEQRALSRILSYITHLVKFKDQHTLVGISSGKKHRIPSILEQKFKGMFTPNSEKYLSSETTKLLVSYVLVLTLYSDDFRTIPDDICRDLRMRLLDLRGIFERLGCKMVKDKESRVATLPLPLAFPQQKPRKKKRGM